jgi:tetratricopeptide (TPR) repeat protein
LAFLQEGYSKAAMLLASERHTEAEALMTELMQRVQAVRACGEEMGVGEGELRKAEAECCVNLASTLLNRQDCEDSFLRIRELLERAIGLDCLSHWAYFNLASYLFRTSSYAEALRTLHCALSCLYLLKAVLSRDLENRNREIDLGRSITFAPNNLQARFVRLLMQVKQARWKMAANEVELALEAQPQEEQLLLLRDHLLSLASSPAPHLHEARSALRRCFELVASIPPQHGRLEGAEGSEGEWGLVVKEIDDRMVEFNEVFRQVNELGSTQNLFFMKALHRTARSDKRIHIISNSIQPPPPQE